MSDMISSLLGVSVGEWFSVDAWVNWWKEQKTFQGYGTWLLCLFLVLQVLLVPWALEVFVAWIIGAACLHIIQDNNDDSGMKRWLRDFVVIGICISCFNVFGTGGLYAILGPQAIYVGFLLLAALSTQPLNQDQGGAWYTNWLWVFLVGLLMYGLHNNLHTIFAHVDIASRGGQILVATIWYGANLVMLACMCVFSGREVSSLLGENQLSPQQFLKFFILGVFLAALPLGLLNPFAWLNYPVALSAVNVVSWEAVTYFSYQAATFVLVLVQTLWEEVLFRTILSSLLQRCGYGKGAMRDGSDRWWHIAMMTMLLTVMFAGAHMANPVETGRLWLSLLEKFAMYSIFAVFSLSYMTTGNIACSWGWHFLHNWTISMFRFGKGSMDNGFYCPNTYIGTEPAWVTIGGSVCTMALNMGAFMVANYYLENQEKPGPM